MNQTIYHVRDDRGIEWAIRDTERAERLSRAGLTVTASMETDGVVIHE